MSKFAIVPGSFDPITAGHFEIIRRAAAIFDRVTVAILVNSEKAGTFSPDERLEAANAAIRELEKDGITNVDARVFRGLTVDAARDAGAGYIVKGLRNTSDFDYEFGMAEITRRFDENIETVFLPSSPEFMHVSSTYVREILKYGKGDCRAFAPGTEEIIKKFYEKK
ncbi:MAG: pantetheine-phosphate adenylyltransferase [Clostridia bacterium]|nr:pantetheine-phosphate adenylyltransferase [Clostridia bacterium]